MRFHHRNRRSNWISELLLKVQLSVAKLGASEVWILVSCCKRGALATYASHQLCTALCERAEKAPRILLTHMCEQMRAGQNMNTLGESFTHQWWTGWRFLKFYFLCQGYFISWIWKNNIDVPEQLSDIIGFVIFLKCSLRSKPMSHLYLQLYLKTHYNENCFFFFLWCF